MTGRPSPITIALAALMGALLVAAVVVMARGRRPEAAAPAPDLVEAPPPAQPPAPAARPAPTRDVAPEPAPAAAAPPGDLPQQPAIAVAPVAPDDGGGGAPPDAGSTRTNRADIRIANYAQRVQEADEVAFDALTIPEDKRAAIRRINEDFKNRSRPGDEAHNATETIARHDAITNLLGADAARDFDLAERHAIRRVRGRNRFEWGRQLRE